MRKLTPFLIAAGVIAISTVVVISQKRHQPLVTSGSESVAKIPIESVEQPAKFIEQNAKSSDTKVQTHVTRARMTLAYDAAAKKDFKAAQVAFVQASKQHKGTDAMHPEFGTLTDQAKYQAIVCIEADGKKDEAVAEYRKFMEERQHSPLVHMCHRRLERIFGVSKTEDDQRLQAAVAEQEKKIRFERSVCGPKVLEKILPLLGKSSQTYEQIAKLAGTSDVGTSLAGMQKACEKLGLQATGLELNAADFRKLKAPAILLTGDHYYAVLKVENGKITTYDPTYKLESEQDLPDIDNAQFRATVLAFEVPKAEYAADQTLKTSK